MSMSMFSNSVSVIDLQSKNYFGTSYTWMWFISVMIHYENPSCPSWFNSPKGITKPIYPNFPYKLLVCGAFRCNFVP